MTTSKKITAIEYPVYTDPEITGTMYRVFRENTQEWLAEEIRDYLHFLRLFGTPGIAVWYGNLGPCAAPETHELDL